MAPCHWLYNLAMYLATPFALWRVFARFRGEREGAPWREYFGFCPRFNTYKPVAWVHAVSLGEAKTALPLARFLQQSGCALLLTYTTPTGRDVWRANFPHAIVAALPFDLPFAARRFLARARPAAGVIMEAEYWHNILTAARAAGVRLMLANGRLGQRNAARYKRAAAFMRAMVRSFDVIAAQSPRDAQRLRRFGGRRVLAAGNLKFDLPPPPPPVLPRLHSKPTVLFAVTRAGEERLLLDAATQAEGFWRQCFAVLALRHPQRRDEVSDLLAARGLRHAARSQDGLPSEHCQVFVADTLGEMHEWYAACDVAIIGGSFLPYGGQNPIEALRAGVAAAAGPYMDNYADIARRAAATGALARVSDAAGAIDWARRMLADAGAADAMRRAARRFVAARGGALARNVALLQELLALANIKETSCHGR